jgi:hypothetical protein
VRATDMDEEMVLASEATSGLPTCPISGATDFDFSPRRRALRVSISLIDIFQTVPSRLHASSFRTLIGNHHPSLLSPFKLPLITPDDNSVHYASASSVQLVFSPS